MCEFVHVLSCVCRCPHSCLHTHPNFLRLGLSLNLKLTIWYRLEGQQAPGIFLFPCSTIHPINTGVTGVSHHAQLFHEFWHLKSDPYVCTASILPTKLTSEPPRWCFFFLMFICVIYVMARTDLCFLKRRPHHVAQAHPN